jgi:hypothetical protein
MTQFGKTFLEADCVQNLKHRVPEYITVFIARRNKIFSFEVNADGVVPKVFLSMFTDFSLDAITRSYCATLQTSFKHKYQKNWWFILRRFLSS